MCGDRWKEQKKARGCEPCDETDAEKKKEEKSKNTHVESISRWEDRCVQVCGSETGVVWISAKASSETTGVGSCNMRGGGGVWRE